MPVHGTHLGVGLLPPGALPFHYLPLRATLAAIKRLLSMAHLGSLLSWGMSMVMHCFPTLSYQRLPVRTVDN